MLWKSEEAYLSAEQVPRAYWWAGEPGDWKMQQRENRKTDIRWVREGRERNTYDEQGEVNIDGERVFHIYHMMIQVVEDAPDSNKRKTDGLDALSLAEYSMNTYKKDLQGEGEDDGRDKQEVQYRQRNKEAVSHPK